MARLDLDSVLTAEERPPTWVVEGIIPAGTIVLVAGDAGIGKTVMNVSEGLHIAMGWPFLGYPTHQTRVLYFDEENSRPDISAYVQQLWIGMGRPDPTTLQAQFRLEHFSLGRKDWYATARDIVAEFNPGMIYIDTATSALAIDKEDDNAEAQRAIQSIRRLMTTASHPAVKVLKHAKFQTGGGQQGQTRRTIRGAKAWLGAVDQVLYHIRRPGRPQRNGLKDTLLIPDKSRAYGLKRNIHVMPSYTETSPNGLILKGESFDATKDLMVIE